MRRNFLKLLGGVMMMTGLMVGVYAENAGTDTGLTIKTNQTDEGVSNAQLCYDGTPIASHHGGGEFSLVLQNADASSHVEVPDWKPTKISEVEGETVLSGEIPANSLGAIFDAEVRYKRISPSLIKKVIRLTEKSGPKLFYEIENNLVPTEAPEGYWTFDHANDQQGGALYEPYPAIGFQTGQLSVGMLTDNGVRNIWNRVTRRHVSVPHELLAPNNITDTDLERIATLSERAQNDHYIAYTFGQLSDYRHGQAQKISCGDVDQWTLPSGEKTNLESNDSGSTRVTWDADENPSTVKIGIPVVLNKGTYYRLKLDCQSNADLLFLLSNDDASEYYSVFHLTDAFCTYKRTQSYQNVYQNYFIYDAIPKDSKGRIIIYAKDVKDPQGYVEIKNLEFEKVEPEKRPYHPIEIGKTIEKTLFIFAIPKQTHREEQIASQTRLAEGLGFNGSMADKICFATTQMLSWNLGENDFEPLVVPSFQYRPYQFMRDAFWMTSSTYDKNISEGVWQEYANRISPDGGVVTQICANNDPFGAAPIDTNFFFVIMAYVNQWRYGTNVDVGKVQMAIDYIINSDDPEHKGLCLCATPGWFDVTFVDGVCFSSMQGMYVNALKCAEALGCTIPEGLIEKAKIQYQGLYDKERGYVVFADKYPDFMFPSALIGEFMSWWLWDEPILSSQAVIGTIESMPVASNGSISCFLRRDGKFVDNPANPDDGEIFGHCKGAWLEGMYMNGGSWLLYEYLAYTAGLKHGWQPARERMQQRLEAEFAHEPLSHEWIPLPEGEAGFYGWWKSTRVYGWNSAVITANEVAGFRSPEQSPHF